MQIAQNNVKKGYESHLKTDFCNKILSISHFFAKKVRIIFKNHAIGHILFKYLLYNNYNCDSIKGGEP